MVMGLIPTADAARIGAKRTRLAPACLEAGIACRDAAQISVDMVGELGR
jgi:hypothetical protein